MEALERGFGAGDIPARDGFGCRGGTGKMAAVGGEAWKIGLDSGVPGLEFAYSVGVMQMINDSPQAAAELVSSWQGRRDESVQRETAQFLARLDFRHISSHINQRKPGYYLILLRNELRHRTLRDKPALTE